MEPRGIRNCNPLNIRRVAGTQWKGQCARQTDPEFVRFESIPWGIRAAFCLLRTYRDKYRLNCITDIITRWAPPSGVSVLSDTPLIVLQHFYTAKKQNLDEMGKFDL